MTFGDFFTVTDQAAAITPMRSAPGWCAHDERPPCEERVALMSEDGLLSRTPMMRKEAPMLDLLPAHFFDLVDDSQWEQWCEWELQCGRERVMDEDARLYGLGIIDENGRLSTDRWPPEMRPIPAPGSRVSR